MKKDNYKIEVRADSEIKGQIDARSAIPFDGELLEASKNAEALDRFDEFENLEVKVECYSKKDGPYGIEYKQAVHGNDTERRVKPHQLKAAHRFLNQLRGFGLLADCVGSGKTYEAGVVLSELAHRNKIRSMLVVVPKQVYGEWKKVLENMFGMGKGVLLEANPNWNAEEKSGAESAYRPPNFLRYSPDECNDIDKKNFETVTSHSDRHHDYKRYLAPIIATSEDFSKWTMADVENVLFDVIVFDEAHHLCFEKGSDARALELLSTLMKYKEDVNVPYCLLLSATPHSGNIENMFRLWYFIRCKGGDPRDFKAANDSERTRRYRIEKEYYHDVVCKGATTVAEFIQASLKEQLEGTEIGRGEYWAGYLKYLTAKGYTEAKYEKLSQYESRKLREAYLEECKHFRNPKNSSEEREKRNVGKEITANIAKAYYSFMRTIMIRQQNTQMRDRTVHNYYFCPVRALPSYAGIPSDPNGLKPDFEKLFMHIGNSGTSSSYTPYDLTVAFDKLLDSALKDQAYFDKYGSSNYYHEQLSYILDYSTQSFSDGLNAARSSSKNHIDFFACNVNFEEDAVFEAKYKEFVRIARENDKMILVFFDYDKEEKESASTAKKLYARLCAEAGLSERVLFADNNNVEEVHKAYDDRKDLILIVGDAMYTEGENFQKCNVLVNFEVTNDPQAMDQRIGRIARLGQQNVVKIYSLAAMNRLEGYCLAYFDRIGLLNTPNGDTSIIAGSNSENMVVLKCPQPKCTNIMLLPVGEYDNLKDENGKVYCKATDDCVAVNSKGTEMIEINNYEFKCDNDPDCKTVLTRRLRDNYYTCMSAHSSHKGPLVNPYGRTYTCSKECAIRHCDKFANDPILRKRCKIYVSGGKLSPSECMTACDSCPSDVQARCDNKCKIKDDEVSSIKNCSDCPSATCKPKPCSITFNEDWVTDCPVCGKTKGGKLRIRSAKTFSAYVTQLYENDNNVDANRGTFCKNLGAEAAKTATIKDILVNDNEETED